MGKVNVYNNKGAQAGEVDLPSVFDTPFRPDLIRKAVKVSRANRRQRYGANPVAGERHATASVGKGRGMSRVPRLTQGRAAALAPPNVGGRRAHPPQARRSFALDMNKKERRLAIASALAATANGELVKARGHRVSDNASFPVVCEDNFASTDKTKALQAALDAMGIAADLERAKDGRHMRSGMGKLRGRRFRQPRSILFVTADGQFPAASNLPGVEVISAKNLSAEHLAPGGDAGRLTVFTKGALDQIKEVYA